MTNVNIAQDEIHVILDRLTKVWMTIGSDELTIWWWDPGILRGDRLFQIILMIGGVKLRKWDPSTTFLTNLIVGHRR